MNTHPDTAARASSAIHQEHIALARQAKLANQAQRHQPPQPRHMALIARIVRLIAAHHHDVTRRPAADPPAITQAPSTSM